MSNRNRRPPTNRRSAGAQYYLPENPSRRSQNPPVNYYNSNYGSARYYNNNNYQESYDYRPNYSQWPRQQNQPQPSAVSNQAPVKPAPSNNQPTPQPLIASAPAPKIDKKEAPLSARANNQIRHTTPTAKNDPNTDLDMNDEWETASDTSQRPSRVKALSGDSVHVTIPVNPNPTGSQRGAKFYGQNSRGTRKTGRGSARQQPTTFYNNSYYPEEYGYAPQRPRVERAAQKPKRDETKSVGNKNDDPRYTAKYWSSTGQEEGQKTNNQNSQSNQNPQSNQNQNPQPIQNTQPNMVAQAPASQTNKPEVSKSFAKQRPINQRQPSAQPKQARPPPAANTNVQVYRVDNIVADNPQAIKDALVGTQKPKNPLQGIDLNNHAGVVIVDYLPDAADEEDEEDERPDDGFQQVKIRTVSINALPIKDIRSY